MGSPRQSSETVYFLSCDDAHADTCAVISLVAFHLTCVVQDQHDTVTTVCTHV